MPPPRGAGATALPPGALALVGAHPTPLEDLSPGWSSTHTVAVTPSGGPFAGERLVVQWSGDRAGIARRLRVARGLRAAAPDVPIPEAVVGDPSAPVPWMASRFVAGPSGRAWLDDSGGAGAPLVGAIAGAAARRFGEVPASGLRLSRTWADAASLVVAARRWRNAVAPTLGGLSVQQLDAELGSIERSLGGVTPVLAHGDLAPVNLLVANGRLVALLDLERARLAHPLFDAAWWCWILAIHHRERARAANRAFLAAAGIGTDADTARRLLLLAALQCLEQAASPRLSAGRRRVWADRMTQVLAMSGEHMAGA